MIGILKKGTLQMSILEDFGVRLRDLRMRVGMSQDALAFRSNLDRTYIGGVERGERNVSLKNIEILCNTLDVDISYFFDNERFSLHTAFLKEEFAKPIGERFVYKVDPLEQVLAWQIKGVLTAEEVSKICIGLKAACDGLVMGEIKLLIDNRLMLSNGQPFVFIPDVMEIWEELQRWFLPITQKVVVLCNSKFMQNQMERLAKRSGIAVIQESLYAEDKLWLVGESYRVLNIRSNEIVKI